MIAINFGILTSHKAFAGSLTVLSDTVSNLTASATASHTIKFTATSSGIPSGKTVTLTFNNGTSTAGVLYSDVTVLDNSTPITVNAGAPVAGNWGFSNSSPTITFTTGTGTIAGGDAITITFNGTNKITNGATGTSTLSINVNNTVADSGALSMAIVTNGVVAVSAQVLATLSFSVSKNAIYFGNLQSSGVTCWAQGTDPGNVTCPTTSEAEAFNMTAATNGTSGYTITVQGTTLTSGLNTIAAITPSAAAPIIGTPQFGIRLQASGGIGTVPALYGTTGEYAYTATASTPVTVASAASASALTTYSVRYMANISPTTPAGSYAASHTYVATGNF
jgi:hypothetical protein